MLSRPLHLVLVLTAAALLCGTGISPSMARDYRGKAHVVDGDTIEIGPVRIRFWGIDAPESKQLCKDAGGKPYACGKRSTAYLKKLIGSRIVTCKDRGPAANNRRRGFCTAGGIDLQQAMVKAGHARAFRLHSERYLPQHRAARAAKAGIWQGYHRRPGAVRACRRQGRGTIRSCSF
jgi:endonuclease YncB( thermonuclease family)